MNFLILALLAFVSVARAEEARLGAYRIEKNGVTVSGISSGAFMAIQMEVAFSKTISGAGSVAGGIFGCAEGTSQSAQINCMALPGNIQPRKFVNEARQLAARGEIDPLENLAGHHLYIFAGTKDTIIRPLASEKLRAFYEGLVEPENIRFENQTPAVHGFPTVDYGNPCNIQTTPWMNSCGIDSAGEILRAMYGELKPKAAAVDSHLHQFSQSDYAGPGVPMYRYGWVYVPGSCEAGETCQLHVALHGCAMNPDDIQDKFARHAGYNEWAEANKIIVLYPQAAKVNQVNPYGCWDWFGYTGKNYLTQSGAQMSALKRMIDRLSEH